MHVSYNEWSLVTTHTTPAEPWLYYYPLVTDYLHLFFQDTYILYFACEKSVNTIVQLSFGRDACCLLSASG